MKVVLDENLSPALAKALAALFDGEHEVVHLREKFGAAVTDREWIGALSADGRWIVISGDRRITRVKSEYQAFRSSRLVGFFLARGIYKSSVVKQMERLLALWTVIEQQAGLIEGGSMFELPQTSSKLRQI